MGDFALNKKTLSAFLMPLIILAAFFIYFPGTHGMFLLDDAPNLRGLEGISSPLSWQKIYHYVVTSGEAASPILRPISMLSFALQYSSWPAYPAHFKLANIALHLVGGMFVYLIACRTALFSGQRKVDARLMAAWSAAFWLLHPINVSTVLYVIQRMAMLSAVFSFASIWLYLVGREKLCNSNSRSGWLLVFASVLITGGLALLSKENGALVPSLLLVLEYTILSSFPITGRAWHNWKIIFLWTPTIFIAAYLISQGFIPDSPQRNFSVAERFLTQFRVLIDYLIKIFLPHPKAFGLYFDDYQKSNGLFQPLTTFFSLIFIAASVVASILFRKRFPVIAFAVLWFFVGHAIESTTIQLELYFEHRNYLPLAGIAIALPYLITRKASHSWYGKSILIGGVGAVVALTALTYMEVQLWSNPMRQAILWGHEKPDSLRARAVMAAMYAVAGESRKAYDEYMLASEHFKDSPGPLTDAIFLRCSDSRLPLIDSSIVRERLANASFSFAPINNFVLTLEAMETGKCTAIKPKYLAESINALLENRHYTNPKLRSHLYFYLARIYAMEKKLAAAIGYAEMANELEPNVEISIHEAEWLVDAGFYRDRRRGCAWQGRSFHSSAVRSDAGDGQ